MAEFFIEYGLFLAKAITVVVAIGVVDGAHRRLVTSCPGWRRS